MIIFADADVNEAAASARLGSFFNTGQCCVSSSRILVHEKVADRFAKKIADAASRLSMGDPLDERMKLGPVISKNHYEEILDSISVAKRADVTVRLGGGQMNLRPGHYIQATILDNVTPDMPVAQEEIFGPVLSIIRFKDDDEAIQIANDTKYGLAAGVWTKSFDKALSATRQLRAGKVWVNTWMEDHAELPFGGYKQSGLGRELGRHAVEEYTETKTVQFQIGPRTPWW